MQPAHCDEAPGCSFAPRCLKAQPECHSARPLLHPTGDGGQFACHHPDASALDYSAPSGTTLHGVVPGHAPIIAVNGLSVTYRRRGFTAMLMGRPAPPPAVKEVSFELRRGEILGLVGESGSGKSTILKVIAGLWPASAGRLSLDQGHDLGVHATRRNRDAQRRVQLVFQNPDASLNPRHTVREILAQPLRLYFGAGPKEIAGRAAKLLEDVRLETAYLERLPAQLSGGERQRVALARAFAAEPEAILCDEVTSALDVSVQASVLRLISDLCRSKGAACIFVSHDLAVVNALAHRIGVLRDGRLIEIGPTKKICT
ncbi:MAG: ATP-binding cassette domain-containing protein, partial [Methylocella sp.]